MRKLLLICLGVLVLTGGCKRTSKNGSNTTASSGTTGTSSDGPSVHASTGVVLNPGVGGGGGGAAQAVRSRVLREVTHNEMKNIQIYIESASGATGQMPTKEEITAALQKESPKTWKLVQEGAIVLTGARSREQIWAYTPELQGSGGHFVVSSSGVDGISKQELDQRLAQQGFAK
jgi:hypothetical protein